MTPAEPPPFDSIASITTIGGWLTLLLVVALYLIFYFSFAWFAERVSVITAIGGLLLIFILL